MRHRRKGRVLGRNPSHQRALLRNLASALFLTEIDKDSVLTRRRREGFDIEGNAPKVPGRVITTLEKAKEVRPVVERCITLACRSLKAAEGAKEFATSADRGSADWKAWRKSEKHAKWVAATMPLVNARRKCLVMLGDKQAVNVLFERVAPRFADRPGGYTRVLRLAKPRLGDAGTRAIIEFVGVRDRAAKKAKAAKPSFDS